jgi:hypothetical protein
MSRNLKYLNDNRVVYKRLPLTDKPTFENNQYMYFEDGTYQCYALFNSKAQITTFKSLKWNLLVLWYLNPQLDQDKFMTIAEIIGIVGELIGRTKRIHEDDIYQCMLDIHDLGESITITKISKLLNCTTRTIHRNMCEELKREKELLNKQL